MPLSWGRLRVKVLVQKSFFGFALTRRATRGYNINMTNNRYPNPTPDSSSREVEEHNEHWQNAPAGSYYANALAFIVESFLEDNIEDYMDISSMDVESLNEFAEMYNTTVEMIHKANRDLRTISEKYTKE